MSSELGQPHAASCFYPLVAVWCKGAHEEGVGRWCFGGRWRQGLRGRDMQLRCHAAFMHVHFTPAASGNNPDGFC
eukprot:2856484-Amphidinium_carterae.1